MILKTKAFDCVEMKNRIQQGIRKEYEAHRGAHASYADFVRSSLAKSEWGRRQLAMFRKQKDIGR